MTGLGGKGIEIGGLRVDKSAMIVGTRARTSGKSVPCPYRTLVMHSSFRPRVVAVKLLSTITVLSLR